jgi:cytosine/adenosine deaminase-related metal-dependent hydrolase
LAEGCQADLVVLDAPDAARAITEQAEKLWVFKAGRVVARNARASEVFVTADALSSPEQCESARLQDNNRHDFVQG